MQEYSTLIADAKGAVGEALTQLPEGELKTEIQAAMEAYSDARQAWYEMLRYDFLLTSYEPGASLKRKYTFPLGVVQDDPRDARFSRLNGRAVILDTIWKVGRAHLDKATDLSKK